MRGSNGNTGNRNRNHRSMEERNVNYRNPDYMNSNNQGRYKSNRTVQKKRAVARRREPVLSVSTIIAVFTLLLIIGGVLIGSSWSDARQTSAANEYPVQKYYTSIEIEAEDTLWSIADTYMNEEYVDRSDYIAEIKKLNQIDENQIHSGQHLLIPYYSKERL